MPILRSAIITGMLLRPIQLAIVLYLAVAQWRELRRRTVWQRIKELLFVMFCVNALAYAFSLFIDLVGYFNWFPNFQIDLLGLYLFANVLSGLLVSTTLLIIYRSRVGD